ncbi:MAG: hypothetical protein ACOC53_05785 [Candidatus Saliniplasma sp.]
MTGVILRLEKHKESLDEVLDEIQTALEDPGGLKSHQRRLAMMLSLGASELIEVYFHKLNIMKPGARIKHNWIKKKDPYQKLNNQVTGDLNEIEKLETILEKARVIERSRNDIAYGSPVEDEETIRRKIKLFFDIKDIIEDEVGDTIG